MRVVPKIKKVAVAAAVAMLALAAWSAPRNVEMSAPQPQFDDGESCVKFRVPEARTVSGKYTVDIEGVCSPDGEFEVWFCKDDVSSPGACDVAIIVCGCDLSVRARDLRSKTGISSSLQPGPVAIELEFFSNGIGEFRLTKATVDGSESDSLKAALAAAMPGEWRSSRLVSRGDASGTRVSAGGYASGMRVRVADVHCGPDVFSVAAVADSHASLVSAME